MPIFDLIVRGGTMVSGNGPRCYDIAIDKGKVAKLLKPGTPVEARRELNALGKLLLPGLIDAHVHFRHPGLTHKENFASGSRAAIAGGVTTALIMPTDDPWTCTTEQLRDKIRMSTGITHCDLGFQIAMHRSSMNLDELNSMGAVSFEVFTADVPPDFLHACPSEIVDALKSISSVGQLCGISPMENSLFQQAHRSLAFGCGSAEDYLTLYPPFAEAAGVARNIVLAKASNARVHIRQISCEGAVEVLGRLKSLADITVEVSPQNLIFTAADYERLGVWVKASPPLRNRRDVDALRAALADGMIDMVVTDHAPHSREEKLLASDFVSAPGGMPGVQTLLPAMLHLVDAGIIRLADVVRLCCENPSKRFGLKQKGNIKSGFDADIIVLDPTRTMTVRNADQYSMAKHTNFDGLRINYLLERVLLRGVEVFGPSAITEPRGSLVIRKS